MNYIMLLEIVAYLLNLAVIIGLLYTHKPVFPFDLKHYDKSTLSVMAIVVVFVVLSFILSVYGYAKRDVSYTSKASVLIWVPLICWSIIWLLFLRK